MKNKLRFSILGILVLCILFAYMGCNKDDRTVTGPSSSVPTYSVTVTVLGPSGVPQGGATVTLQNPPYVSTIFSGITNSYGIATIQAPAGYQTIIATMGSVFQVTVNVTVAASSTPTVISTPITLVQNTTLGKTLVIYAGCETIETVLANPIIGYTTFDHTTIDSMRIKVNLDSTALLNYLKQYAIVFSDCNCGDETGYPKLARLYGRYVQQGGKIYGGHYNYMNLQYIFYPNYQTSIYGSGSQLKIVNTTLSTAVGYTVINWPSSWYSQFSDIPTSNSTVYAVISGSAATASSSQGIPIIVENRLGTGKYVWTTYHNQDILSDTNLVKIVRYFLYNM